MQLKILEVARTAQADRRAGVNDKTKGPSCLPRGADSGHGGHRLLKALGTGKPDGRSNH
jgi:hypothetical protein